MNDVKIRTLTKEIEEQAKAYNEYVESLNPCAYSDRMVETIIEKAKELEFAHESNFSSMATDSRFAKNINQAAALCHITLVPDAVSYIIKKSGPAMVTWTIDDYITAVKDIAKNRKRG